jgi:hypothetical protein
MREARSFRFMRILIGEFIMKKEKHLGIRINANLHYKLHYVAKFDGRSCNGEILYLLRQYIAEFEKKYGEIEIKKEYTTDGS